MIFGTGLGTPFIAQRKLGIPGKLFGLVRGAGRLAGGLTNSLKGTVSAGAVLAGALHLNMALAGTVPGGGVLGGALTAASPVAGLPAGYAYLLDSSGNYLVDSNGAYLIGAA